VDWNLALGLGGIALGVATYVLGKRAGQRTEEAIRGDFAGMPRQVAEAVTSMLDGVSRPPTPDDPDRGWEAQLPATTGSARINPDGSYATLVELPYGAHSALLLAFEDTGDPSTRVRVIGTVTNGTGARFHLREASDGGPHEVVTLDHIRPIDFSRSMAEMPVQTVYYRLIEDGFVEAGRGEVYDGSGAQAWDIPKSVEPFLSPQWISEVRS
jgi:hypothetical protein